MSTRRRLAREKLEVYLVHLILSYRRILLVVGFILLMYVAAMVFINPSAGILMLIPAIFLLLTGSSFTFVLFIARAIAWLGTLQEEDI